VVAVSSPTTAASGPSDAGPEAKHTDVEDEDELREELLRVLDDQGAGDLEMMEARFSSLLSDTRRAIAEQGGDADE